MSILSFWTKPSADQAAQAAETERCIEEERGKLRNAAQVVESHSRRLTMMANMLELRGDHHAPDN